MGAHLSKNAFPVHAKTVLVTGGSRGLGLEVSRQLAAKGANIVIVARDTGRLKRSIEYIRAGAASPTTQRFHQISADLTQDEAASTVIAEVTAWNSGPPDIVWCCAGSSHPTIFLDTEPVQFRSQMDSNYFSTLYIAHAALRAWLKPENLGMKEDSTSAAPSRQLVFTSSFLALYPIAGYSPYSPSKAALRSLFDTLSQETKLYTACSVGVHLVLPASILGEALDSENRIKSDLTKMLEESDEGLPSAVVAAKAIKGLESGHELVTTDLMTRFVMCGTLGASVRGGFLKGLLDWFLGCLALLVLVFVRQDMDSKVRKWAKRFGDSGFR
ncbi:NAD(P)-binding protein [Cryphonectria parasitica EP155]|uniref:3-dehydrosphinganine reductase n=1 Tax=Cryphonectria parasitica (strain ATCC 38755 / EP155) TaxID=660469 RepID=A0A9P4XYN1_CRYP1|nr:NAD(P)-binding protein [Cryphonectria parasitica EP155]KAF3763195.1 NAD(P)-binding protein [Cryphonectria parasitica EP155]